IYRRYRTRTREVAFVFGCGFAQSPRRFPGLISKTATHTPHHQPVLAGYDLREDAISFF
ncbi:unnamed protein product, partial [Musa textilis]